MGCDIHPHVEIKIHGKWEHLNEPAIERNYGLFALLAGVRSNPSSPEPIAPQRGLPKDISVVTRIFHEKMAADAHSASWISGEEMERAIKWHEDAEGRLSYRVRRNQWGWLFGNYFQITEDTPPGVEDVRMVFWFDN